MKIQNWKGAVSKMPEGKVIKRDKSIVDFDRHKIENAIAKAYKEVYPNINIDNYCSTIIKVTDKVIREVKWIAGTRNVDIEVIQDVVERELMDLDKSVAKEYITYRYTRKIARNNYNIFMESIKEKLMATNVQNQNANVDEHSFGGRLGETTDLVSKRFAIENMLSEKARYNHLNNLIYIHDLSHYAVGDHNCLSIPFDDLLAKGFNTRQTDVRPAQSVNTAFQLVAVIFQLQSLQQFGGVSATHLDWTMVPYVRKSFLKHYITAWIKDSEDFLNLDIMNMIFDDYKEDIEGHIVTRNRFEDWVDSYKSQFFKQTNTCEDDYILSNKNNLNPKYYQQALYDTIIETKQAVEGMYHNLNTLQSRSGNQLPFTSINYGTCTSEEGRLVTKSLLDCSIKGIGKLHKTSIFPCGIFQCMKGINRKPGEPNYDLFKLALKSTALRLYPNYANVDWTGNAGYDPNDPKTYFSTMGCRTANGWDINGLGQLKDGRGNICPVSIILPSIAMLAKVEAEQTSKSIIDIFMNLLDTKIHEAKDMLIERFEWICSQPAESAKFMYENKLMAGYIPEEGIRSALKHGTLALGQLGLAETLQILLGCNHLEPKGMDLAKQIEQLFKDRCAEFKEKYKLNFGVYFTPAENLCYTAMTKFKEKYGEIPNVSDRDYFTNSIHVPVWEEVTPFEKIDIESQLTGYSSAGCITYVEFDSTVKNNIDSLEVLVNYALDKDIPYLAINLPNDLCLNCGFTDEINDVCPMCASINIRRLRRVTGYLTGDYKTAFNKGKQQEVEQRVKHTK